MFNVQLRPGKRAQVKRIREAVKFIRDTGRQVINERLDAVTRGHTFDNDILSYLLDVPG